MAIRIITDSASDITQEEARTWGIAGIAPSDYFR